MLNSSNSIYCSCWAQCSSGNPVIQSASLHTVLAVILAYGPCVKHSHREETPEEITPHLLYVDLEVRPVISFHSLLTRISHMVPGQIKCAMKYEEAHRYMGNNWTLNIAAISHTQSHFKVCQYISLNVIRQAYGGCITTFYVKTKSCAQVLWIGKGVWEMIWEALCPSLGAEFSSRR